MTNIYVIDLTSKDFEKNKIVATCCGVDIKLDPAYVKAQLLDNKRDNIMVKCDYCDSMIMLRYQSPLDRLTARLNTKSDV